MTERIQVNRRELLKVGAAAAVAPYFVPASSLGKGGKVAPSERIVMGCIGTGGKGRNNLGRFMKMNNVQVVAVCDVDAKHRQMAQQMVQKHSGKEDCAAYNDFRELVQRKDIDTVSVATPDHWHALTSIAALEAGKDVYCEKPLANSIAEGRAICDAAEKNNRILQTGSHERSTDSIRFACELVRNGRIGQVKRVRIQMPCDQNHHKQVMATTDVPPTQPVPEWFDYDFWLGHTAKVPYTPKRCHFWWRFILAYGGGEMTDRGAHIIDIAQLGLGMDDTGPVEIAAKGSASKTSLYDAFMDYEFTNTYANGVQLIGENRGPRGLKFEGTEGSIFVHIHGGKLEADPASLLQEKIGSDEVTLGRSPGHHQNFIECVRTRKAPFATAEIGHRTATICHLNNIAMKLGRKLAWDPDKEEIKNDPEANALLAPKMREPWTL